MTTNPYDIVSLEEMKIQLREPLDDSSNDAVIEGYITAAIEAVGSAYGCPLVDKKSWLDLQYGYNLKVFGTVRSISKYRFCPYTGGYENGFTVTPLDPVLTQEDFVPVGYPEQGLYHFEPEILRLPSWPSICYGTGIGLLVTFGLDKAGDGSSVPNPLKQAVRMLATDYWNKEKEASPIIGQLIQSADPAWSIDEPDESEDSKEEAE